MSINKSTNMEIERQLKVIEGMKPGTDEHAKAVETLAKLIETQNDKQDKLVKNVINGVVGVGGLAAALVMGVMSMNFEKYGTFTTEAGRNAMRQLLRFKN